MGVFDLYADAHDPKYGAPHEVPLKICTPESIAEYGRIVHDFEEEEVWIVTWPQQGWRPICSGTGNQGGVTSGAFRYRWEGDELKAVNEAVGGDYTTGRLPPGVSTTNRTHVLVREANYHPDGGQVFFPTNSAAFVLLLALPGDDIKLSDFVAFYCDGSFGVQIRPGIWHQPLYPIADEAVFRGKQGRVHACVAVDTVTEFGKYLKVPLKPEMAK